jgi:hypothetical protein
MEPKVEFSSSAYDCARIARGVTITVKTVRLYGGLGPHVVAPAVSPQRCSGMPICQLFSLGKFPQPKYSAKTGCPYIDTRKMTGR